MNKKEKVKLINTYIAHQKAIDEQIVILDNLFGTTIEGKLIESMYEALEGYLDCVEKLLGYDVDQWLHWYVFDNDCGKRGFTINGKSISSTTQFVNMMEKIKEELVK